MAKTLKATHRGYIRFGSKEAGKVEIPCAVLENEQRIISHTGLYQAFKRPRKAEKKNSELPSIISARNLLPFVTEEVRTAAAAVYYFHTNGTIALGYSADFLPLLCQLYLKAEKKGSLLGSQKKFAAQAKILQKDIPKKGLTELIDEVTGLKAEQEQTAIKQLLKPTFSGNLLLWQGQFPTSFYKEVFRLHKWPFKPNALKKNEIQAFANFLNNYIYYQIPDNLLKRLKAEPPKSTPAIRPKKTEEESFPLVEEPYLNHHLVRLMTVMELSDGTDDFKRNFNRVFKKVFQMTLGF